MARFVKLVVAVPVAILLVAFAIANRQMVKVSFDPFSDPSASASSVVVPLFVLLFIALIVGTFLGGVATWIGQGRRRRRLRLLEDDVEELRLQLLRYREGPPTVTVPSQRVLARPVA